MAFTDAEIASHAALVEILIWKKHRPPLHLRDRVREGQRVAGSEVELFLVRPMFRDPTRHIESSVADAPARDPFTGDEAAFIASHDTF